MVGRKKKTKILSQGEDRISQLPDPLICDILYHLSTKDAVRTSTLSTRWRKLWQWVPGLDLGPYQFSNSDAFVRFVESFFDSHRESQIRKLRLVFDSSDLDCDLTSWIDVVTTRRIQHLVVTTRRIQHLDVNNSYVDEIEIPLSLYTCETLVHLRLCEVTLCNAEFVALPCLKIMHLEGNRYLNNTTLQKLISGSPVLEDLTIIRSWNCPMAIQVRSHTVKRIDIDEYTEVVIDAPLLHCLRTKMYPAKKFQIINLGFPAKLDIDFRTRLVYPCVIRDILTGIPRRVRDLVISSNTWKVIFQYSKSGPVLQFHDLSRIHVKFSKTDLEMLPTLLESCTKLESLILEIVENQTMGRYEEKRKSNVRFSAVPRCLVSSLKFVELKRSIPRYDGEMELVRYFLKNSTILEKLRLNVYYSQKAKCAFLTELVAMPRCSSSCEVIVL